MENTQPVIVIEAGKRYWIKGRMVGSKEILNGRMVEITKGSKQPGYSNGHLVHKTNGSLQKTLIAIPNELLVPAFKTMEVEPEAEVV